MCYSTCPPKIDLKETFRILHPGAENIEDFSVRVGPDVIGTTSGRADRHRDDQGRVDRALHDHAVPWQGFCHPSADVLPTDGSYEVQAFYNGDATYSPATSHPVPWRSRALPAATNR